MFPDSLFPDLLEENEQNPPQSPPPTVPPPLVDVEVIEGERRRRGILDGVDAETATDSATAAAVAVSEDGKLTDNENENDGDDAVSAFLKDVSQCKDSLWYDSNHEKSRRQQQQEQESQEQEQCIPESSFHSETMNNNFPDLLGRSKVEKNNDVARLDLLQNQIDVSADGHSNNTIGRKSNHSYGDDDGSDSNEEEDNNNLSSFPDMEDLVEGTTAKINKTKPVFEDADNNDDAEKDIDFSSTFVNQNLPSDPFNDNDDDQEEINMKEEEQKQQQDDANGSCTLTTNNTFSQLNAEEEKGDDNNEEEEEEEEEKDDMFLVRTKGQTVDHLNNAYSTDHGKFQNTDGRLETSLCEDVYYLVRMYYCALKERFVSSSGGSIGDDEKEIVIEDDVDNENLCFPALDETDDDGDNGGGGEDDNGEKETTAKPSSTSTDSSSTNDIIQIAMGAILKHLYEIQIQSRDQFLVDLETCCAAANDFIRMSDTLEEFVAAEEEYLRVAPSAPSPATPPPSLSTSDDNNDATDDPLHIQQQHQQQDASAVEELTALLLGLYNRDAIFAARKIHIYVMDVLETNMNDDNDRDGEEGKDRRGGDILRGSSVAENLFGKQWLHEWLDNDLALIIVRTIEDFVEDLELFLDPLILGKTLEAIITSVVVFYIKNLICKSSQHLKFNKSIWKEHNKMGLDRMMGDIKVLNEYFDKVVTTYSSSYPNLIRTIEREFEMLYVIHEILSIAAGVSNSHLRDHVCLHYIFLLHKRLNNVKLTKYVIGDLCHLVNPQAESEMYNYIDTIVVELETAVKVWNDDSDHGNKIDRNAKKKKIILDARRESDVPGLRLDEELATIIQEYLKTRVRPGLIKTNSTTAAAEQGEIMWNMLSQRSTNYRKKVTKSIEKQSKSIQKQSKKYSRNISDSFNSISMMAAGTSARKHVAIASAGSTNNSSSSSSSRNIQAKGKRTPGNEMSERKAAQQRISSKLSKYKKRFV